jgi:hypothetical protein
LDSDELPFSAAVIDDDSAWPTVPLPQLVTYPLPAIADTDEFPILCDVLQTWPIAESLSTTSLTGPASLQAVQAGSTIIVMSGLGGVGDTTTTVTDSLGNSYTNVARETSNVGVNEAAIWKVTTPTGGANVTITVNTSGADKLTFSAVEVPGLTGLVDKTSVNRGTGTTPTTGSTGTLSSANELAVIVMVPVNSASQTITTPSGFTRRVNESGNTFQEMDGATFHVGSTAALNPQWTLLNSANWLAVIATFPCAGPPPQESDVAEYVPQVMTLPWTVAPVRDDDALVPATVTVVEEEQPPPLFTIPSPWRSVVFLDDDPLMPVTTISDREEEWGKTIPPVPIVWRSVTIQDDDALMPVTTISDREEDQGRTFVPLPIVWQSFVFRDDDPVMPVTTVDEDYTWVRQVQAIPWTPVVFSSGDEIGVALPTIFLDDDPPWVARRQSVPWTPVTFTEDGIASIVVPVFFRDEEMWTAPRVMRIPWTPFSFLDDEGGVQLVTPFIVEPLPCPYRPHRVDEECQDRPRVNPCQPTI